MEGLNRQDPFEPRRRVLGPRKEKVSEITASEIAERIQSYGLTPQIDEEELEERRKALSERSILDSVQLGDALIGIEETPVFRWVPAEKIIGRSFAFKEKGGWSFEYEEREGRSVTMAQGLLNYRKNPEIIESVFHPDKPSARIKLVEIPGPAGSMFFVEDGTHRFISCLIAGLREIPCDVRKIQYPPEQRTDDEGVALNWRKKINRKLIEGEVREETREDGRKIHKLTVIREIFPWIRTNNEIDLCKISKAYEELYPGSLNNLKNNLNQDIPHQALVEWGAFNFYLAGRWNEWMKQYSGEREIPKE
jgi:hypothetical protein